MSAVVVQALLLFAFMRRIVVYPFPQEVVLHKARTPELASQRLSLLSIGAQTKLERLMNDHLLSEGMRLEVVQQFLGHASPETTRKAYAMTWDEVMDNQVATYRPALSEAAERAHGKVKKYEIRKKALRGLR
jgi:hypothetical protein